MTWGLESQLLSFEPQDACPNPTCGHPLEAHTDQGCLTGWEYNDEGISIADGCRCNLMIAPQS